MKKLLFILLLPLTVFAVPIEIPVTTFYWEHDGINTDGYKIECDGKTVFETIDITTRTALISDTTLADGNHSCLVLAYQYTFEARSESVDFFIRESQPYKIGGDLAVPTFGVR